MIINNAQGQSSKEVGIDLREKWEDDPLSRYTHDPS
jgi:hypothetical protein